MRAAFFFVTLLLSVISAKACFASNPGAVGPDRLLAEADRLLSEDSEDPNLHFIKGMALAEIGQYMEAAAEFRWLLAKDPNLQRPRLELARVLFQLRRYDSAKYHFEQVLASNPPAEVGRNIRAILAAIRERTATLALSIEFVSDSNPGQQTSAQEVEIQGLRYEIDNNGRPKRSSGIKTTLEGQIPLDDSLWFLKGYGEVQEYANKRTNFQYVRGAVGRHISLEDQTFTLEVGTHKSTYGNRELFDGLLAEASHFRQWRNHLGTRFTASSQQYDYKEYPYLSGWQYAISMQTLYAPSSVQRWEFTLGALENSAKEAPYSYSQASLSARYGREWKWGWGTAINLSFADSNYKAADPIFLEKRHDFERRAELEVRNSRLRFWELTPVLHAGWVDRHSNIDLYGYRRAYFRIGVTGVF